MKAADLTLVLTGSFRAAVMRGAVSPQTVAGIILLQHEGDAEQALGALPTWFPEDVRMREFLHVVRNLLRSVVEAAVDECVAERMFVAPRESEVAPRLRAIEGGKP